MRPVNVTVNEGFWPELAIGRAEISTIPFPGIGIFTQPVTEVPAFLTVRVADEYVLAVVSVKVRHS